MDILNRDGKIEDYLARTCIKLNNKYQQLNNFMLLKNLLLF